MKIRNLPIYFAALALLLGILVIIGWYTQTRLLIQILPTLVPMQFNTALLLSLSGLSLLFLQGKSHLSKLIIAAILALFVIVIAAITLAQYFSESNYGVDQLFFEHKITTRTHSPGRMAPNTALCYIFIGLGSLILSCRFLKLQSWIASSFAVIAAAFGIVSLIGYCLDLPEAYGWSTLTDMAVHTGVGFILLSAALYISSFTYNAKGKVDLWALFPLYLGVVLIILMLWRAIEIARVSAVLREQPFTFNPIILTIIALLLIATIWLLHLSVKTAKRLEQALNIVEQASEEKTNILHYISHEIRNPLNVIIGYSEPLEKEESSVDEYLMRIRGVYTSAKNIQSIVNDLLSWSTIKSGKIELDFTTIDLESWKKTLEELLTITAQKAQIEFKIITDSSCPAKFQSDQSKLTEIISNLVNNAIKNTPKGGKVELSFKSAHHKLFFSVKDTGRGIPKDKQATVLLPFMQARKDDSEKGLGLGLAICKRFLDSMQGSLELQSVENVGTTIICSIPLKQENG